MARLSGKKNPPNVATFLPARWPLPVSLCGTSSCVERGRRMSNGRPPPKPVLAPGRQARQEDRDENGIEPWRPWRLCASHNSLSFNRGLVASCENLVFPISRGDAGTQRQEKEEPATDYRLPVTMYGDLQSGNYLGTANYANHANKTCRTAAGPHSGCHAYALVRMSSLSPCMYPALICILRAGLRTPAFELRPLNSGP